MASKTLEMDSLKKNAVHVYQGMIAVYPHKAKESEIDVLTIKKRFEGCYAIQGPNVGFVFEGEVYVTPCTDIVIRSLEAEGLKQKEFYVPFSQGDYPKNEEERWVYLRNQVLQSFIDDFIEDCTAYSDEHNIGVLSKAVLKHCIQIPFMGMSVTGINCENCYYPVLNIWRKNKLGEYIGRYNINNEVVMFVYRDGRTYLSKGYRIVRELKNAGYVPKNMFVPLSSGEKIQDEEMEEKWESIKAHELTK